MTGSYRSRPTNTHVLVEHVRGMFYVDGAQLVARVHRATFTMFGAGLLLFFGIGGSVLTTVTVLMVALRSGFEAPMLLAPFLGLPFVAVGSIALRNMLRGWGDVVVDTPSRQIVWMQGTKERGRWSFEDCTGFSTHHAFLSTYRLQLQTEQWLKLVMRDGTRVPMVIGVPEEIRAVRDALRVIEAQPIGR